MRFGGHETFAVRETWLSKGLRLIDAEPEAFNDPLVGDVLGVGANMAKAIRHWLRVTGLADGSQKGLLEPTDLGRLILTRDPAMLQVGTWWALHASLCGQTTQAVTWHWMFSRFAGDRRFDRLQCIDALRRYAAAEGGRPPSPRTVAADVACLLATYARPVPPAAEDPEDAIDCPFRRLGLMVHHRDTDTYRINRGPKPVPPEILCWTLARCFHEERRAGGVDIPLPEAVVRPGGPGRVFALPPDALALAAAKAEQVLGSDAVRSEMVGGDRVIRLDARRPIDWLVAYYRRMA